MGNDVLVIAEHRGGQLHPSTLELVKTGKELASETGGFCKVVVLDRPGGSVGSLLSEYGIEIFLAEHELLGTYTLTGYALALEYILEEVKPRAVLLPHSSRGIDLAPRLASIGNTPIVTNCVTVVLKDGKLLAIRRIFNDKIVAYLEIVGSEPFIVTMRMGSGEPAEKAQGGSITPISFPMDTSKLTIKFHGYERPQVEDVDLAAADVIVSAGRGMQKKENIRLVEELAGLLGGVVGGSRPVTDMEWLPKTRQVGQSGKTVRPKLYVACGISGAMQHVSGMKDSELIIAINTDPTAPIFEVAHYGVVANVLELLPSLIKELKSKS